MQTSRLPAYVDILIIPFLNLLTALFVAGIIIAIIGENPFTALSVMLKGAFIYKGGFGYTLFTLPILFLRGLRLQWRFMQCCLILAVRDKQQWEVLELVLWHSL